MKRQTGILVVLQLVLMACPAVAQTPAAGNDWKAVEQALGRSGQQQADGAYKFGLPRGDLNSLKVDRLRLPSAGRFGIPVRLVRGTNAPLNGEFRSPPAILDGVADDDPGLC